MTAKDAVSITRRNEADGALPTVDCGTHLLEVLPKLLDSPGRELAVSDGGATTGVIDQTSLLEALGRQISPRYDCSVIEVECSPADYSASHIARAVEDSDVHLVDLLTNPADGGHLRVTLRVRCDDPLATVHSLERYGYSVTDVHGHGETSATAAIERLLELQALINV